MFVILTWSELSPLMTASSLDTWSLKRYRAVQKDSHLSPETVGFVLDCFPSSGEESLLRGRGRKAPCPVARARPSEWPVEAEGEVQGSQAVTPLRWAKKN